MKPYFATTEYSTVASAVLTILHSLNETLEKPVELNQETEFQIWQKTTILPTRASSIFALAKLSKEHGAKVKVVAQGEEYDFPDYRFYRYTKEDVDHAKLSAKLLRDEAKASGINVEIKDFTLDDVKSELKNNNIILLRLNVKPLRNLKRNSSNYVILHGFDGKNYSVIDTADSARTIPEELLQECFETLESKKHRDHRMLVFEK